MAKLRLRDRAYGLPLTVMNEVTQPSLSLLSHYWEGKQTLRPICQKQKMFPWKVARDGRCGRNCLSEPPSLLSLFFHSSGIQGSDVVKCWRMVLIPPLQQCRHFVFMSREKKPEESRVCRTLSWPCFCRKRLRLGCVNLSQLLDALRMRDHKTYAQSFVFLFLLSHPDLFPLSPNSCCRHSDRECHYFSPKFVEIDERWGKFWRETGGGGIPVPAARGY